MTYLSLSGPAGFSTGGQAFKADARGLVGRGPDGCLLKEEGLQIYRRPSSWALINASWRDEIVSF